MLSKLIDWSLQHRLLVMLGAGLVCVVGLLAMRALNVDAFPDTTPVQVQINARAAALVPEEIERQITIPIEIALSGLPGLVEIRSISLFGLSQVVVTFRDGVDIYFARQLIFERLGAVTMPPGVAQPEMGPVSTGLGEVYHYLAVPRDGDLMSLRTLHDWTIKPQMRRVAGTAEVNSWGGLERQFQVKVDPTLLVRHGLSFQQVVEAVRANNANVGGGSIDKGGGMMLVHGLGRTSSIPQIENIVIAARDGVPIRVMDVAQVQVGSAIRAGAVTASLRDPQDPTQIQQSEAVLGLCFMLMGQNSYDVTRRMASQMSEVKSKLPAEANVAVAYDRTELVDRVIATVKNNLLEGAVLVVLLLFVFLGNLRAGLICAAAIPLSMLVGFCGMWSVGIAGSLLSLGAIDFGVVVDSSVVVIESIVRRLGHMAPASVSQRLQAIRDAAVEVRTPTVFGQLIIMIVYVPILTLEGVEGKMFRPMALTVIFILVGSLLCSLTVTPVLASLVLPKNMKEEDVLLVRILRWLYRPLLAWSLRAGWIVLGICLLSLAAAGFLASRLGSEFVPRLSEGSIVIGIIRPPGTSLDESLRMNRLIEAELLREFPDEVELCWSRVGSPEVPTDASTVEVTDLFVKLYPRDRWKQAATQAQLVELMERRVAEYPGQTYWFTQPIEQRINEMVSGVRADVALKLFGPDFAPLIAKARDLESVLKSTPGCADLSVEQMLGQPILQIAIKQDQIARYGIPAQTVLDLIESLGSKPVGDVIEGPIPFPLVIRLPDAMRTSPEAVGAILVSAPNGERIPLARLAEIRIVNGPRLISREQGHRRITIQCNVRGRDVGSFVKEAQERIAATIELPAEYRIEWGGQFENMQRAQRRLTIVVPLALLMIIALLFLSFRNRFDTLATFVSVPFACCGGIAAVYWREMPLSISAAVGFITLSGISVLNGMVLVSAIRDQLAKGADLHHAVSHSALECLRTIVMTALVASVGFIPMAVSTGAGAEVQRPLASVVIGGVATSTLFCLFALPAIYVLFGRRRSSAVEPATAAASS
ncbi:MAG: CusA/CzcA family heavy metal efflux RND transporter [Pirellulales bacterium]